MGQDELKVIATELVTQVRKSVTIDWISREIKVLVKRILCKHSYPPALQDEATKLVLQQAELLCVVRGARNTAPHREVIRRS